jgi:hypothetical protein
MHQFHKFILAWNSTCFGQFLCPSSGDSFRDVSKDVYKPVRHTIAEFTVNKLLMMDRRTVRNMYSFMPKQIWETGASGWFYYKEITTRLNQITRPNPLISLSSSEIS